MNRARWITFALAVAVALILGYFVARWAAPYITRDNLEGWVKAAGAWGPFVLLAVQAAQILAAPIPGVFVPILAGVLYGPVVGSLLTMVGTLLGANAAYWIGRSAGHAVAERWIGAPALEKARALLQGKRWLALAAIFWIPFSPADSLCFVSGIVGMRWLPFMAAVLAGRLPKDVIIAAGSALGWNGFGLGGGP
ncbi:MAG TPA: VTT domain-containing protein [Acidobacteriota bacterium]|nr:VTT domain-containing protein [Acidobacteriota bacterium]